MPVLAFFYAMKWENMKKNKIQEINSYNQFSNEDVVNSVLNTLEKISNGISLNKLTTFDIKNIENFYKCLTLEGALGMLTEGARVLAYEEIKHYVGDYIYSNNDKRLFLEKYMELLEYRKSLLEDQESSLKLA